MLKIFVVLLGLLLYEAFGEHIFHLYKIHVSALHENNN
jgi:hypothetical protein